MTPANNQTMRSISTICLVTFALFLFAAGCQNTRPVTSDEKTDGVRKPAAKKIYLIQTPRTIREDTIYPESTKQAFFWYEDVAEWRFKFPPSGYAHAGFRFLYPYNLSNGMDEYKIIFTIKPASMVKLLWLGLIDGNDIAPNLITDVSVGGYAKKQYGPGSTEVSIPIRDFPSLGHPVHFDAVVAEGADASFDWQDVLGLRFIHNGGRIAPQDIIITHLRIAR